MEAQEYRESKGFVQLFAMSRVGEVVNQPQVGQLYHILGTYATSCNLQQLFSGPLLVKQGLLPVISCSLPLFLFDAIWVQPCMFQMAVVQHEIHFFWFLGAP